MSRLIGTLALAGLLLAADAAAAQSGPGPISPPSTSAPGPYIGDETHPYHNGGDRVFPEGVVAPPPRFVTGGGHRGRAARHGRAARASRTVAHVGRHAAKSKAKAKAKGKKSRKR